MQRRRQRLRGGAALLGLLAVLGPAAPTASAAAPAIGAVWVFQPQATTMRLGAEVDPGAKQSSYRFDYITRAAYEQNLGAAEDGFTGASRLPASGSTNIPGTAPTTIAPLLFGLVSDTAYRYRLVVSNADGSATSGVHDLATHSTAAFALPNDRGWELVSPVEKNGGAIADPAEAGSGTSRAAAQGGGVTFASKASFAGGAGAAPFSQYLASRRAGGWQTQNLTPAHLTGAYEGAPYVAFSTDLARSLYLNPARCPSGDPCLPGYQLRESSSGTLLGSPADPGFFASVSEDLSRVVFSKGGELYRWSPPSSVLFALGATPSATPTVPQGSVSSDGLRVYYEGVDGNLHLREGGTTKQVDAVAGGGGSFEVASPDGATALYTKAGHLYRYLAATNVSEDLVPSGGVLSGSAWLGGGSKILFASTAPLTTSNGETYDNTGLDSGQPAAQVYLYDAGGGGALTCVSCNPTYARPLGPSSVPGSSGSHQPRAISADGSRVFFDSEDALVLTDTNLASDVYQWSAPGSGGCIRPRGCLALISAGLAGSATFVDASADGADVFFLTDRSLVGADPGSVDLYDARVGGGFPEPGDPSPCIGDACQMVPAAPEDPVLTTMLTGPGNPTEQYSTYGAKRKCPRGRKLRTVKGKNGKRVTRCLDSRKRKKRGGKRKERGVAKSFGGDQ